MSALSLQKIGKRYRGGTVAVADFSLEIKSGELVVLTGPSGCGKSSVLRIIAGLEAASEGEITLDGKPLRDIAPKDRGIAMVFEDYALYPNMTIFGNMAFGLKLLNMTTDEIKRRVLETAGLLDLTRLLGAKPAKLSDGQRLRAALGRAAVKRPQVLLLDEPLLKLDEKLRPGMRAEILKLCRGLDATVVYATRDQAQAMALGGRVIVMKDGGIRQTGLPDEIYAKPRDVFVAGFMGFPAINLISAELKQGLGETRIEFGEGDEKYHIALPAEKAGAVKLYDGSKAVLGIRPEDLREDEGFIGKAETGIIGAVLEASELVGAEAYLYLKSMGQNLVMRARANHPHKPGDKLKIAIDPAKIHLFDGETEETML